MSTLSLSLSLSLPHDDAGLNGRPRIRGLDFSRSESLSVVRGFPNANARLVLQCPEPLPVTRLKSARLNKAWKWDTTTRPSTVDGVVNGCPSREPRHFLPPLSEGYKIRKSKASIDGSEDEQ